MDQVTQQNAALVEQMAAAASSLRVQAGDLVNEVAVFSLDQHSVALISTPKMLNWLLLILLKPSLNHLSSSFMFFDGECVFRRRWTAIPGSWTWIPVPWTVIPGKVNAAAQVDRSCALLF
jgi:hypothetical protein